MPQILHVFTMLALMSSHLSGADRKEHFHKKLMFIADTSTLSQVLYSVEAAAEAVGCPDAGDHRLTLVMATRPCWLLLPHSFSLPGKLCLFSLLVSLPFQQPFQSAVPIRQHAELESSLA